MNRSNSGVMVFGILLCCVLAACPVVASAQEPAPPVVAANVPKDIFFGKNFVLFPVTTALQRELLKGPGADPQAYALLNGRELIHPSGMIDPESMPMDEFVQALRKFPDRKNGSIVLCMDYGKLDPLRPVSSNSRLLASSAWAGVARSVGFKEALSNSTHHNDDTTWQDALKFAPVIPEERQFEGAEEFVSDQRFVVAPVRTTLSRVLTNNAGCHVTLRNRVTTRDDLPVTPESIAALKALLDSAGVTQRTRILLRVSANRDGPAAAVMNEFFEKDLGPLAKSLGFETSTVAW